ncbi:hypothetical protein A0J57_13950 [Sphingobium sp. 22B]|uniref:hypothetical protein n=1 Tax=unclassified Sphingobium TaxID=2611147 RepID=UPI000780ED7C|nr:MULTISPECIES: hypothetical protein [unclassified Sphingobium]KXU30920.1 hypothetical protein AXW74_15055 [Sphingobium sp. AM]KYC31721.1 hypothetical protein A0J57_13950 [Sphingobium sp. 22B]OAP31043.1 hypothetical protein A8O16_15335 [Sphingobium sp. 20006FA]
MANPVTPQHLNQLLDSFPEVAEQIAACDHATETPLVERLTRVIFENDELVRHLAAIGRGVSVDAVRLGSMLNMLSALGCLAATSRSPHVVEMVEIAEERLSPSTAVRNHLRLIGSNDQ